MLFLAPTKLAVTLKIKLIRLKTAWSAYVFLLRFALLDPPRLGLTSLPRVVSRMVLLTKATWYGRTNEQVRATTC